LIVYEIKRSLPCHIPFGWGSANEIGAISVDELYLPENVAPHPFIMSKAVNKRKRIPIRFMVPPGFHDNHNGDKLIKNYNSSWLSKKFSCARSEKA